MARPGHLISVFNVQCVMCGRGCGLLLGGSFIPREGISRPKAGKNGESRCGECGGNLYLEPDDAVTPFMAAQIARRPAGALQAA